MDTVVVSSRGVRRWRRGHSWIYRSDVERPGQEPGVVRVEDPRGSFLGQALWSPPSEISLRFLTEATEPVDRQWWHDRLSEAHARRDPTHLSGNAYRMVHAEGDGLPSLIVDRYGDLVVAQLLSAGLEAVRDDILSGIDAELSPKMILLRNDASVRRHEDLPLELEEIRGPIPELVEAMEGNVKYLVSPATGQKTGAFLDQRENRLLMSELAHGEALDLFTYQGLFALQMAGRATSVIGVDSSDAALELAAKNSALNNITNVEWIEANVFDLLREFEREGRRFDTIVLDPPAFARQRASIDRALRGYKEINLRAMRILAPKGTLLSASCSFHVGRDRFYEMLTSAASDSGRRLVWERSIEQSRDHPQVPTIPETMYLKGAVLRAMD